MGGIVLKKQEKGNEEKGRAWGISILDCHNKFSVYNSAQFLKIETQERNNNMRKFMIVAFVFALMLGGISAAAYAMDCTKDTPVDQVGDWFATFGKQGMEKDQILAKRKADRLAICAKKQAQEAIQDAKKASEDMKKKLGF